MHIKDSSSSASEGSVLPWLTGETLIYGIIIVIAFGLRIARLAAYPLNDLEAAQALVGLEVFQGGIPADASDYSPLMVTLNSLTFLLFGPSDSAARLASVLLGMVLVILPWSLRRQLGVLGALTTSALLAISASALFWSRTITGDMAVAVGAMLVLVGGFRWLEEQANLGLFMIVGGLVLCLLGAPSGFTAVAILLIFGLIVTLIQPQFWGDLQERIRQSGLSAGQAALLALALLVVLGTAGLFNITGLSAVSDSFNNWLLQFGFVAQPGAGLPAVLLLLLYEPVIVLFGLIGVVRSFRQHQTLNWILVIWLGVAILFDLFMGGRSAGQLLLALLPLTLLAGQTIGVILTQLITQGRQEIEGLFVAFGLVLCIFVYVSLTSYSKCTPTQAGCNTAWILPLAGSLLVVGLFVIFWAWYGVAQARRSLAVLLLVVIGLFSIGTSWRLNFGPLANLPFQPMLSQPASTRLVTLLDDLARLSTERSGDIRLLDLVVVDLDRPILRWHLRDFENARYLNDFNLVGDTPVIIASLAAGEPVGGAYTGQDLALIANWNPFLAQGKDALRWYLFRFLPNHNPASDQVVLWVRPG